MLGYIQAIALKINKPEVPMLASHCGFHLIRSPTIIRLIEQKFRFHANIKYYRVQFCSTNHRQCRIRARQKQKPTRVRWMPIG